MKLRLALFSGALALALPSASASARPSVFVHPAAKGAPSSWYNLKMDARILGQTAGGVTTAQVNKFIEAHKEFNTYTVCSLEAVGADTFVGLDKVTQNEIDASLKGNLPAFDVTSPDGRKVMVRAVVFEACDGDETKGAAILITDPLSNAVLTWEPMGEWERNGESVPVWAVFLDNKPYDKDASFSYSLCQECGAVTAVYYDVRRKKFYFEYNGH